MKRRDSGQNTPGAPEVAAEVAAGAVGKPPEDPPKGVRPTPAETPLKRRRGAPKGNVNRAKDPRFTLAMREAQRLARRGRQRRRRGHLAEARRIVAEAGLGKSPLGERIALRLADVEAEIDELQRIVERVGRTRRDGSLCEPYKRRLALIGEDRAEIRALVDRLVELRRPGNEEHGALSKFLEMVHGGRFEGDGRELGDEGEDAERSGLAPGSSGLPD